MSTKVRLIEKLQKAIMIVRMCRALVLAASKHRKSCGGLCLHCVDLPMPPGPGWALHALSAVDIHTRDMHSYVYQLKKYASVYFHSGSVATGFLCLMLVAVEMQLFK